MKTLIVFFVALTGTLIFADDGNMEDVRVKEIVALHKTLSDPKATDAQKADAARFADAIIDMDTKIIANYREQIEALKAQPSSALPLAESAPQITEVRTPPPIERTQAPPLGSWHQVANFSGSSEKNTEPFAISSGRWRVKWTSRLSSQARDLMKHSSMNADSFTMLSAEAVSDDSSKAESQDIVSAKLGSGADSSELRGGGNWRIKVNSANCDWTLAVEEFR